MSLLCVFVRRMHCSRAVRRGRGLAVGQQCAHQWPGRHRAGGRYAAVGDVVLARLTFHSPGVKGLANAVAFQKALVNEVDVSAAAQDGQIAIDTPPVTDLGATVSGGAVVLTWSHVGSDANHYEMWRATNLPYFTPLEGTLIAPYVAPESGTSYSDSESGLCDPAANSFYLVRSVDAAGRPAPTYNRVGVFNFALQTENP